MRTPDPIPELFSYKIFVLQDIGWVGATRFFKVGQKTSDVYDGLRLRRAGAYKSNNSYSTESADHNHIRKRKLLLVG
ncbi:hypothetical protein CDG79_25345 [Nostoc sp. 'Peltigera membranacea cyanobiont' 232]|nr:hypothetical protein CDG79_25345 [Nostoc sp. 'Peltigera membranacea cyanobiont' 232]